MADSPRKIKVAVVFGGQSTEHSISCISASSVLSVLDRDAYEVVPVGITPAGGWVLVSDDPKALRSHGRELPQVAKGTSVMLPADPTRAGGLVVLEPGEGVQVFGEVDVVFPVLHGAYGEDGTIQGLLEMAGVPYVGSGVLGSAVSMDKEFTKKLLRAAGLPVGAAVVLRPGAELSDADRARLGLPVFVKPARGGSSIGVSKVEAWEDLPAALQVARAADPKVLVEAATPGREIECGVLEGLDGGPPEASLPAEVRMVGERSWYDFEAKYLDVDESMCEFDVPADLPGAVTERVRAVACAAFEALECAGLARVDFFVDGADVVINEVNTMPGFTPISMFPRMWQASGLSYPALVDRLVRTALHRGTGLR